MCQNDGVSEFRFLKLGFIMKSPKSTAEFFTHLPPETTIDILSRLPIRTIARSKLVCRSWRDLLRTREFADSHLSRSSSGLAICEYSSELRIFEFEDEHNHQHRHNPVTGFPCREFATIRLPTAIQGSANGLLFVRGITRQFDALHICNPITRECIQLPTPENYVNCPTIVANGFGVSKITGRYKVVRVSLDYDHDPYTYELVGITKSSCHVYTLGTGKWRSIVASVPPLGNNQYSIGAFLNGSLHWFVEDFKGSYSISRFDLETETFGTFALPPLRESDVHSQVVVALGDYLCVCDNLSEDEVVVWLMKVYGDEKSWTKEIVIRKPQFLRGFGGFASNFVCPVRVFERGHVLMSCYAVCLFCYSNETENAELAHMFGVFDGRRGMQVMLHRSSFLSLKCFPMENVTSF